MSDKEVKEFSEKLRSGLEIAEKRMLEEKALRGEDIIVSSDGKTIELSFRRALLYPFNYQGNKKCCKGSHFLRKMTTFAL